MFNRMVVATDLSPASDAVVGCLGSLRGLGVNSCLLLHCSGFAEASSEAFEYDTSHVDAALERQKAVLESAGFAVETRIEVGSPKHEINRVATDEEYPLLVVGSRGHTLIGETLLGGVAYSVAHTSRKPVLVVPVRQEEQGDSACVVGPGCEMTGHVLLATDFSENADHALVAVEGIASGVDRITLIHVQDKDRIDPHLSHRLEKFNEIDTGRLERMKESLRSKGAEHVHIELAYGTPYVEILRIAKERDADMIVVGTQGRRPLAEIMLGGASHNVVRHAATPVLLVPVPKS